jgi:4-hydroxy-tetrahydrodipicolinate reductase
MKIGLAGYGKMGRAIEEIAIERGHDILFKSNSVFPLNDRDIDSVDVVIEFTKPDLAVKHIEMVLNSKKPIVVGTTGWNEEINKVESLVSNKNGSLLYASNFSIGVNLFFELNEKLAKLMSNRTQYKASIDEVHHTQKIDSPSGTAITLANQILENNESYFSWVCEEGTAPHTTEGQLGLVAHRIPDVPGTHTVSYSSEIDTLSITHQAHNRKGFALGAVLAAEWIFDKKGVYTIKDMLQDIQAV